MGTNIFFTIQRYCYTIYHLRPIQIIYQIWYRLYRTPVISYIKNRKHKYQKLNFLPTKINQGSASIKKDGEIFYTSFLNKHTEFKNKIDWTFSDYGKLWNYHLQYFEFLKENQLSTQEKAELIHDFYTELFSGSLEAEPYPVSLRIMNVIRFISLKSLLPKTVNSLNDYIYSEASYISTHFEYHLLGNHLLENAFSLLMAGYYFNNNRWIKKAEKVLFKELNEQTLDDGAHVERTVMYHSIILYRVLEALQYIPKDSDLSLLLKETAKSMFGWINTIMFRNYDFPHFNDSTTGQAPSVNELKKLAEKIGVVIDQKVNLSQSGYRKIESDRFELIADIDGIHPTYQPGHAHADSLSFILYIDKKPVFVDPGITTYDKNSRRSWERSTRAHNTVNVNNENTADTWGGFRVGYKPKIKIKKDGNFELSAVLSTSLSEIKEHKRSFILEKSKLAIEDFVETDQMASANFCLHPSATFEKITDNTLILNNTVKIEFYKSKAVDLFPLTISNGFNKPVNSTQISVNFFHHLKTIIGFV